MSYNPIRAAGKNNHSRTQRTPNPHSGTKHSDIIRRRGVGKFATDSAKEDNKHGFSSNVFSCESFVQRYVCLYAGNNTGMGVNKKGCRTIRVMAGTLYVTFVNKVKTTSDAGEVDVSDVADIVACKEGQVTNLPKGTRYSLAASGTANVELLITETANYQDTWKELGDASVNTPKSVTMVPPSSSRRPRGESKALQQAQRLSNKKGNAQVHAQLETVRRTNDNINSSTHIGVNPRPSGPPRDSD